MKRQKTKSAPSAQSAETKAAPYRHWSAEEQKNIVPRVVSLVEPLCATEGLELVHVEFQRESAGRTLRLFIDRPGGVTMDDCVWVSRQVGDLLDVYLEDAGAYRLEVSSPGLNRPLGKQLDFERFKGRVAKIKTVQPIDGQRNFKGVLAGLSDGVVRLDVAGTIVAIPFAEISKAQLVADPSVPPASKG